MLDVVSNSFEADWKNCVDVLFLFQCDLDLTAITFCSNLLGNAYFYGNDFLMGSSCNVYYLGWYVPNRTL